MDIQSKELFKVFLKEKFLEIILEGGSNSLKRLESIVRQNQSNKDSSDPLSKNYLFNQPLSDKTTLLYVACREGKYEIVKFMLENNFDPHIRSFTNQNDSESCLQVAARWGMVNIVQLLLEKSEFSKEELLEVIKMEGLNREIRKTLSKYYAKRFSKLGGCLVCWDFK